MPENQDAVNPHLSNGVEGYGRWDGVPWTLFNYYFQVYRFILRINILIFITVSAFIIVYCSWFKACDPNYSTTYSV